MRVVTDTTFKPVTIERLDWSDLNIYDMSVMPWDENQVIIGRYQSVNHSKLSWAWNIEP